MDNDIPLKETDVNRKTTFLNLIFFPVFALAFLSPLAGHASFYCKMRYLYSSRADVMIENFRRVEECALAVQNSNGGFVCAGAKLLNDRGYVTSFAEASECLEGLQFVRNGQICNNRFMYGSTQSKLIQIYPDAESCQQALMR